MSDSTTARAVLEAARKKIEKPEAWTRHFYARDENGTDADPFDEGASCWCAFGALAVALEWRDELDEHMGDAEALLLEAGGFSAGHQLAAFNDDPATTHADILALFDRAIALAGGAP